MFLTESLVSASHISDLSSEEKQSHQLSSGQSLDIGPLIFYIYDCILAEFSIVDFFVTYFAILLQKSNYNILT